MFGQPRSFPERERETLALFKGRIQKYPGTGLFWGTSGTTRHVTIYTSHPERETEVLQTKPDIFIDLLYATREVKERE